MANKNRIENSDIIKAIEMFGKKEIEFEEVSETIALECLDDGCMMAPVVFRNGFTQADADRMLECPEDDFEIDVEFRMVDDTEGGAWVTAFTDDGQLPPGDDTGLIAVSIEELIAMAAEDEEARGLAINPFTNGLFIMKDDLQMVIRDIEQMQTESILLCGVDDYNNGNYEAAVEAYEEAASRGNIKAMSNLGYCHYYGRSLPVNKEKARICWEKAAAMGDPCAVYKLADMYRKGDLPMDVEWARMMYLRAFDLALRDEDEEAFPDAGLRLLKYCREDIDEELVLKLAEDVVEAYEALIEDGDPFAKKLIVEATAIRDSIRRQNA